jgi:hypothetical protein
MGISEAENGGTVTVPYKAIFWGNVPLHSPLDRP